ncbi:MlaE family lipid ABC transporter permease subunit [candidate division KSB1 bacterium]|nr:MlaE family lipid ABC transporter permease subunit [candidate division KSB1 bacterium]
MLEITISENTLFFSGDLKVKSIKIAFEKVNNFLKANKQDTVLFDLSEVRSIDSAGISFLDEIKISNPDKIQIINIPTNVEKAIQSFSSQTTPIKKTISKPILFEWMGEKFYRSLEKFIKVLYLTTDIFYWSVVGLFRRKGQREGSFIQQSLLIGVDALLIVGLISFLIGFILALQSAAQLRQFGANIFIADLIGIAMFKEMGPIMTAIVVAGRSGSAIASEVATMVVTEEIDALKTMALNPIRYIIVPKFHAITVTMPLLTILSDLIGIFGGFIIGITYLQLSPAAFYNELMTVLILRDVFTGLAKSVVFAWIIVIVGCYFGMQVKGGAEGVGKATTASVVASIFFVIIADSILGLIFYFGKPIY